MKCLALVLRSDPISLRIELKLLTQFMCKIFYFVNEQIETEIATASAAARGALSCGE